MSDTIDIVAPPPVGVTVVAPPAIVIEIDSNVGARGPQGIPGPPGPQGAPGESLSGVWRWQAGPITSVSNSQIGTDTGSAATASLIRIHPSSKDAQDFTGFIQALEAGDTLFAWDADDSTRWVRFSVLASAVTAGAAYAIPIRALEGAGSVLTQDTNAVVTFTYVSENLSYTKLESDSRYAKLATVSTEPPSGGADGDVWYQVT